MINTLPKALIDTARKVLLESTTHIDVDGELKHRYNSEGALIHPTDEGIKNFHRWFGDSDSVDEHGRPLVVHHSTPALSRGQTETTPLPFNEFKNTDSGLFSFSKSKKFAQQYAETKSMDAQMDLSPFTFHSYVKTKTFDPNNEDHINKIKQHLGDTVTHAGKYGWSAFAGDRQLDKDKFIEKLKGIHDVYRPLTKEMHDKAEPGKMMTLDGGNIYVHHKTPTHLYYSEAYQINGLKPEHFDELKQDAQKEPVESIKKEFKYKPSEERYWEIKRQKVNINNTTYLPAKERGDNWEYTENDEFMNAVKTTGFNAVKQTERNHENIAVFDNHQIKSATHNDGSFSHPTQIDK